MTDRGSNSANSKRPTRSHLLKLEEIKAAAARQFYAIGYSATDLRSIANEVDLHVSTLYSYISGKEELLFIIMQDGMTEITGSLDRACTSQDPVERLRSAIEAHIMHHVERPFWAWTSHIEIRSLTGAYRDRIMKMRHEYEQRWLRLLTDARESGDLGGDYDLKLTMYGILGLGISVANWYRPDGRLEGEQIATMLTTQILDGLLPRPSSDLLMRGTRLPDHT
jgi:TetR/AcrR family transcriptional regulator, cholesterol catabolism regulator